MAKAPKTTKTPKGGKAPKGFVPFGKTPKAGAAMPKGGKAAC